MYVIMFLLLFYAPSAHAQSTQFCWHLGADEFAEFADTWQLGQAAPSYPTLPLSNCPQTSYRYSDGHGGYTCVDTKHHVTFANFGGLGTCEYITNRISNIVTYECYHYDVCMAATHLGEHGMCQDRRSAAATSYAIGLDCNNMTALWQAELAIQHDVHQTDRPGVTDMRISGTVNTNRSNRISARCGTWTLSGWISGSGHTTWRLDNPNYPNYAPDGWVCYKYLLFNGTTAPTNSTGTFTTPTGRTGEYPMTRIGNPPGAPGTRQSVPEEGLNTPNPYSESTSSSVLPLPGIPVIQPFRPNYSSGDGWVRFEWMPAENASSYDLYRCPNAVGNCTLIVSNYQGNAQGLNYTMSHLQNNVPVYFTLRGRNATGLGGSPPIVTRIPMPHPGWVMIEDASGAPNQLTLRWGTSANATGYRIWSSANQEGPWNLRVDNLPGTARSYTLPATDGITLNYIIQAFNGNGDWINSLAVPLASPCGRRKCIPGQLMEPTTGTGLPGMYLPPPGKRPFPPNYRGPYPAQ